MENLLIANIFSFISAIFTAASSWTKDPGRTYYYQVWQCLVYAIAAYFFGAYAAILMMIVNAFRNLLVAKGKYSRKWMILCAVLSLILGVVTEKNAADCLSVFLTVYYTVSSYFLKEPKAVKINVAIDLGLWFVFDLLVGDVSSGIVDIIGFMLAVITFFRLLIKPGKKM